MGNSSYANITARRESERMTRIIAPLIPGEIAFPRSFSLRLCVYLMANGRNSLNAATAPENKSALAANSNPFLLNAPGPVEFLFYLWSTGWTCPASLCIVCSTDWRRWKNCWNQTSLSHQSVQLTRSDALSCRCWNAPSTDAARRSMANTRFYSVNGRKQKSACFLTKRIVNIWIQQNLLFNILQYNELFIFFLLKS